MIDFFRMGNRFTFKSFLLGMSVLACFNSCADRLESDLEVFDDTPAKTILAYISADNPETSSLFPYVQVNLNDMAYGMRQEAGSNCNILAFVDGPGKSKSYFMNIHDGIMEKVFIFDETNVKNFSPEIDSNQDGNLDSSNPATLRMAIDFMMKHYPDREYGLILWSHGGGWIPRDKWNRITEQYTRSKASVSSAFPSDAMPLLTKGSTLTRYFAYEPSNSMELDELAAAIPDHCFDFIVFDACYMGCVEVAYALRNKTRYIISSTTEIMGTGFPYRSVAGRLANGYLIGACREFYTYYNNFDDYRRLGEVSLVCTGELDSLACCFRKIVSGKSDVWRSDTEFSNIQYFDRFNNGINDRRSVFFDLNAVARTYSKSEAEYNEFRNQLERCILYAASTPELFIYYPPLFYRQDHITVNEFSGLSVYIPFRDNDAIGLNDSYAQLEWSKETNYK